MAGRRFLISVLVPVPTYAFLRSMGETVSRISTVSRGACTEGLGGRTGLAGIFGVVVLLELTELAGLTGLVDGLVERAGLGLVGRKLPTCSVYSVTGDPLLAGSVQDTSTVILDAAAERGET